MPEPSVWVILLSWNNWPDMLDCIRSLKAMEYPNWSAVVVDNGSKDDTVERLRAACPHIPIITNGENLGFAAGCNVGIRYALDRGADYIWLLNADTKVDRQALGAMIERAEADPSLGAVGSVVYFMDEPAQIQAWGGGRVNFWIGRSRVHTRQTRDSSLGYILGASMLIRRQPLETVGLLDEGFFMFWEETDYCFRLRAAGWRLATAPTSKIYHKGSASFAGRSRFLDAYFTESARLFFRKHARFPGFSLWAGVCLSAVKRIAQGRWKSAAAVLPGRFRKLAGRDPSRA